MITLSKILGALCTLSLTVAFAAKGSSTHAPSITKSCRCVFLGSENVTIQMACELWTSLQVLDVFSTRVIFPAEICSPLLPQITSCWFPNTNAFPERGSTFTIRNGVMRLGGILAALGKPENLNGLWFALQSECDSAQLDLY
jgi:hypothetical protein